MHPKCSLAGVSQSIWESLQGISPSVVATLTPLATSIICHASINYHDKLNARLTDHWALKQQRKNATH